ncbi:MAG TPA: hypothetical protein VI193_05530 [Acidimicrobiia bacterium]
MSVRSTTESKPLVQLSADVCLVCGSRLRPAVVYDGDGEYLPAPVTWRRPKFLGVRGRTERDCDEALDRSDPHKALWHFEVRVEKLVSTMNPEAHRLCVEVIEKSHADVEGKHPSAKTRIDRAELKMRGQSEFHTWRQASWAWHVLTYGMDEGWDRSFGWITEGYVFPAVTRPLEQRYIDLALLPRYPDGSPYAGPEDPKKHGAWIEKHGAFAYRTLEEARLIV